jgi:hypothetical protein
VRQDEKSDFAHPITYRGRGRGVVIEPSGYIPPFIGIILASFLIVFQPVAATEKPAISRNPSGTKKRR